MKTTFLNIPNGLPYDSLSKPLEFENDPHGLNNWVMRLPLTIYSLDFNQKHFFEDGSVTISINSSRPQQERWKYFVVTASNGSRLYCSAQIFYEKGYLSRSSRLTSSSLSDLPNSYEYFYLPRCLVLMSEEPFFKMQVNLLRIYCELRQERPTIVHPTGPRTLTRFLQLRAQKRIDQFQVTHQDENDSSLSPESLLDYYLWTCRGHRKGEVVLIEQISHLPLLHLYSLSSSCLFQFSHCFNLPLSSKTIGEVLTAILLEQKVIVVSSNCNLNVIVIESLLQLVRPLKWEQNMLVHDLPPQLIDAVNENFMPFLVGIHSNLLSDVDPTNKFILHIEEDRLATPFTLPSIGKTLDTFVAKLNSLSTPFANERAILQHSIELMCQILLPIVESKGVYLSQYGQFYGKFSGTSLCSGFLERIGTSQIADFMDLILLENQEERTKTIEKELNMVNYFFQNPRQLKNEVHWIEYYLSLMNPELRTQEELRLPSLRDIQQNVINEARQQKMIRKIHTMRDSSGSRKLLPSSRKIKVSGVKGSPNQQVLFELLDQRLGIGSKLF